MPGRGTAGNRQVAPADVVAYCVAAARKSAPRRLVPVAYEPGDRSVNQPKALKVVSMGIGASIFLIAVGAVLAFALEYDISGIDLSVVGWILMLVGGLGLLVTVVIWAPRRGGGARDRQTYRGRDDTRRMYGDGR